MTKRGQVWKCEVCGNIMEILHKGADSLVCCGEAMILMEENNVDAVVEKHKPVIKGKRVSVGSVLHPMSEEHYIEWIEGIGEDGKVVKKFLKPGVLGGHDSGEPDEPVVEFCFDVLKARAYCNLHGLWTN